MDTFISPSGLAARSDGAFFFFLYLGKNEAQT